jgi:hypothetical protein
MKLKDLINILRYGELTNISWDNESRIPQVIAQINLGLLNLYSKFPILEKSVAIAQYPHISIYNLTSQYARTNTESTETYKYILDTQLDPFKDDILQITAATDEFGRSIPLNDDNAPDSWFLPAYNQLQIPNATLDETAFLIYRAKPEYIDPETKDLDIEVFMPQYLVDPLVNYVAYKIFIGMGGENAQIAAIYQQLYEKQCMDIANSNLLNNSNSVTNIKPLIGGYV